MSLLDSISRRLRDHPLSFRLLTYIFAFSSVFTLLGTGVQLYWEYRTDLSGIADTLQQIEDSHLGSLTTSQWLLDEMQIQAQLDGILQLPDVQHVEIRPAEEEPAIVAGGPVSENQISRTYPMVHDHLGQPVKVGELMVVATLDGVYARLREKFLVILGTQAVKTFATSLFILFVVQYLITRHLHTLARYARRLSLDDLDTPLELNRGDSRRFRPDELDHVVAAIEGMRSRLSADLSALWTSELERERLIADLEAKNSEMERFTYTVSHDLKSPLFTIQGFLGLLEKDLARSDAERVSRDLERISAAATQMSDLLQNLLDLSRAGRQVGQGEEVAMGELAREVVELLSGQIAARGVSVEVGSDLPVVFGDRSRLLQVLQNLLENSVKFMGDEPAPRVEIGTRHDGGETVCFVRDNGIGIELGEQGDIFGLFSKLDERGEGSGIGLALVHRIVTVHHGRVWVESEGPGRGATFCFTLPGEPAGLAS